MRDLRPPDTVARLPANPDLAQERRRAKDLLKAVRSGDSAAIARLRSQHPRLAALSPGKLAADVQLSDAQLVIAREHGFASWPSLKTHIEQASGRPPGRPPYSVLIWSDETTPTEFVVLMLKKVFGRNEEDAERIWLDAYHEGFAICAAFDRLTEADAKLAEAKALVHRSGLALELTCAHGAVAARVPRRVEKELDTARARQVRFDDAMMYVELIDGRTLCVPLDWFPELLGASADQRQRWALSDQGRELSWEFGLLVSVTGLLAGRAGQSAIRPAPVPLIAACRDALAACSRQDAPLAWAAAQNELGHALYTRATIGLVEKSDYPPIDLIEAERSDCPLIEEAIAAYREAIEECTRERAPLDWARIQRALGDALHLLGGLRDDDPATIEGAVTAFRAALDERTRLPPGECVAAQTGLGWALRRLGVREAGTDRLHEAVAAFGESLDAVMRERFPFCFATSAGYQGGVLALLAERQSDPVAAERAVTQLSMAIEILRECDLPKLVRPSDHADNFAQELANARTLLDQLSRH
jgi:ATP-dependent Clp protease adapter protein ClpS